MISFKEFITEDKEPIPLITRPEREFHKKLRDDIKLGVKDMMEKIEAYQGWRLGVGDRFKSNKTGKVYQVTGYSWNIKFDSPMYLTKTIGEEESGSQYAVKHSGMKYGTGVHELLDSGDFIKLGTLR